ncbi:tyrosine-protein phosphatase [Chelatococcus asaccharovorans]|uniref:Protein-tyrosine phosphatase n=1 Tax=Chelatococcus asaccharovorans TaxID=28210 RepID=A0A2V3U525_9HYPH|nr:tyrosine-protein phosphatase [Chelatococcus asaccharovorans]MBS7703063.1 tyrosine-protein phosphatase [Chelatococcus asaccharovorans]PXW57362.1 protein-tyrosine phosphatase [Chelatococcus asaccharovorans]
MQSQPTRHLKVTGTYNVRDLGGYVTATGETRWRRLLRADGLHRLDEQGMATLVGEGVTTVIDLRHADELARQPNPFGQNPAVRYHHVSLFDELAPTRKPGCDVLLELYKRALAERQEAIATVLTTIAEAPDGVVLFHCTAGKDRTGIVALLLLALAGVETALIVEDYAETGTMIAPMVEEIIAHAAERGADIETFRPLLAAEPETMVATIAHLSEHYGSARHYLKTIGLSDATLARLHDRLVGEA